MKKEIIMAYIRGRLGDQRFNMSDEMYTAHNQRVLNLFAHLDIHEHVNFMYLTTHKGHMKFICRTNDGVYHENDDLGGYTTSQIIYMILSSIGSLDTAYTLCTEGRRSINKGVNFDEDTNCIV